MHRRRHLFALLIFTLLSSFLHAQTPHLWRSPTGGRIRGRPAATSDGRVYALSEDRHLYAFEEATGTVLWRAYLGGRVWNSLSVGADGTVYTVLKDGDLVAVNRSGNIVWRFKARGVPAGNPAAGADGTVFFALDDGTVFAVSHTGKERWNTTLPAPAVTGPAIGVNGDVYVGSRNRMVYALFPWGGIKWNALLAGVPGEAAVAPDGTVYFGTDFGSLVALDSEGSILWDHVNSESLVSPVVGRERVYTATASEVFAFDFSGELVWTGVAPEPVTGPLVITAGNDLLALSSRERLLRFRDDGVYAGRMDVKGSGNLFTVSPRGRYVFGRSDWLVYAYEGSLPLADSWSQPGKDPRHTSNAMARPGSTDWLDQFRSDVEFAYLEYLVEDASREAKLLALDIINEMIYEEEDVRPYLPVLLGELASEGTLKANFESGRVVNDFPEIRRTASEMLGDVGTLQSGDLLVRLLTFEYDSTVQLSMIRALGALMSDRNGLATAAVSSIVMEDLRRRERPDSRIARETLSTVASVYEYHGEMPHESGYEVLFEIYRGAYPKDVREMALAVMRRMSS